MAFEINKILRIRQDAFNHSVEDTILTNCEKLVGSPLHWVEHEELKPKDGYRRFLIKRAFNQRDK